MINIQTRSLIQCSTLHFVFNIHSCMYICVARALLWRSPNLPIVPTPVALIVSLWLYIGLHIPHMQAIVL